MTGLIGREREWARLGHLLERAEAGDGGVALIRGEAGIGKTALARLVETTAADRGFRTVRGRCHPHGSEVSYGPLVEAFGRLLRHCSDDELEALVARLAGLSLLFPGILDEPDLPTLPPELALTRTLEAIRGLLVRIAAAGPLLLVIDDVQWADAATLRALAHVAGELEVAPIALVMTLRDGDQAEHPEVRTMLMALRRSCPVDEVTPDRLGREDTGRILQTLTDRPVPAELVDRIHRRTAGTPLFVESLGREIFSSPDGSTPTTSDPIPPAAVRDVIAERLEGLDEDGHDVLAAISMASASTDLTTVQRVTQLDDGPFTAALERLLARSLVSVGAGSDGVVEAAHPLIAEVTEHRLPPPERARLHARFLAVGGDALDPEVAALHVLGAGDRLSVDRALTVLDAAAAQAASRQAYRSTVAHASRALDLIEPLDRPNDELAIRHRLASALLGLGDFAEAATVIDGALQLEVDDPVARLPVLSQAELVAWLTDSGTAELERLDGALAGLPRNEHRPEVLRALELRLTALARRGSTELAGFVDDLVDRTADGSEPAVMALHSIARAYRHEIDGRHHLAIPLLDELLSMPAGTLPTWQVHRARVVLVDCLANTGPVDRLRSAIEAISGDGEGLHLSWRDHIVAYHCGLASLEPDCLDLSVDDPIAFGPGSSALWPDPSTMAHRAWLLGDRNELDAVADLVADKRRRFPDRGAVRTAADAIEDVRVLLDGDPERARARLAADHRVVSQGLFGREAMERTHRLAVLAGEVAIAIETERELRRIDGGTGWASAQARFLQGLRLTACGGGVPADVGGEPAPLVLGQAADQLGAVGDRHRLARCLVGLAEATGTVDPRLPQLLGPVSASGLALLAGRIRAVVGPEASADAERGAPPPLTRRQREIAELVAEGLSNAAIADRLFISVRTVTSHLDHIYTKLGIGNRTELAVRLPELP